MSSKQDVNKAPGRALAAFTSETAGQSRQPRQLQFQQIQAALDGDPQAQRDTIPLLDRALQDLEVGRSQALSQTRDRLNRAGIPGQNQAAELFEVEQAGRITEAATRDQIVTSLIGAAPETALSLSRQAAGGLQAGAARAGQAEAANAAAAQSAAAGGASAAGAVVGGILIAV